MLVGCVTPPPHHANNICSIFEQYPKWYWAAQKSEKQYGMPISSQMAIMYQESRFQAQVKPPRGKLLWVIPWFRPTSAYGYSQALDETWENYEKNTGESGDRDEFADASRFISWYGNTAHRKLGIPLTNTYAMYLAYHEGMLGYQRGTFKKKPWLMKVAKKVSWHAVKYHRQLEACAADLPQKPWYKFWQ